MNLTEEQLAKFSSARDNFIIAAKEVFDPDTAVELGEAIQQALETWQPEACDQLLDYFERQVGMRLN